MALIRLKFKIIFALLLLLFFACPIFALEVDYPTIAGQTPGTSISDYVKYIFIFFVSATGFIAVLILAFGSVQYMTASGNVSKMKDAKVKIFSSSLGILLLLSSYIVLNTINPNLIKLEEPTIAQLASTLLPKPPISSVPTADLLTRIKKLAEDTEEIPDVIYNSAKLIGEITNNCDCKNTKPMCSCEETLECPSKPWYTAYSHLDKIGTDRNEAIFWGTYNYDYDEFKYDLKVGECVTRNQIIGEVGKINTDTGPHLHFQTGFLASGSSITNSIDIRSKISAPGGIKGDWPANASPAPLPSDITQKDIDYILRTLVPPLSYRQCAWYENKNSNLHDNAQYWAQDWRCLSDNLTEKSLVTIMSGGDQKENLFTGVVGERAVESKGNIVSRVERIVPSEGTVIIRHECVTPTPSCSPCPSPIPWCNKSVSDNPFVYNTKVKNAFANRDIFFKKTDAFSENQGLFLENNVKKVNFGGMGVLAKVESLAAISCPPETPVKYFYNNYQSEGCCWSPGSTYVCGPAGNQTCCSKTENKTCVIDESNNVSCCPSPYPCGSTQGYRTCCSAENPLCKDTYFYVNGLSYRKGICCPASKTNLCYKWTLAKQPSCCLPTDNCIEKENQFDCCDKTTSIICGDAGHQICCTDPDGNPTTGSGTTDVLCAGTKTDPQCIVRPIFTCPAGQAICGTVYGRQACCSSSESCLIKPYIDEDHVGYWLGGDKGYCCQKTPVDKTNICYEPTSNWPQACCTWSEACMKKIDSFGCCNKNTSRILGTKGFQICCEDPDGFPEPGYGATTVIDTGTWNNPICTVVPNKPPFSCVGGTTTCGAVSGYQDCCAANERCNIYEDLYYGEAYWGGDFAGWIGIDAGFCCPNGTNICAFFSNLPPICCSPYSWCLTEGWDYFSFPTTPPRNRVCCDWNTSVRCDYYIGGLPLSGAVPSSALWLNQLCCTATDGIAAHAFCSGSWYHPICLTTTSPNYSVTPPAPLPNCYRFLYEIITATDWWIIGFAHYQTFQYIDICCNTTGGESACPNYHDPQLSFCCPTNQKCVNDASGARCCPAGYTVCGEASLKNQICCEPIIDPWGTWPQVCGGDLYEPKCFSALQSKPIPTPISCYTPTPTPLCSPSCTPISSPRPAEIACSATGRYDTSTKVKIPASEFQTCCPENEKCYLEDKDNNPVLNPWESTQKYFYLKNSIGKCCPTNKNLFQQKFYFEGYYLGYYGACCEQTEQGVYDQNGVPHCAPACPTGQRACGRTVTIDSASPPVFTHECCASNEKCINNKCTSAPSYCESPLPSPHPISEVKLGNIYPEQCSCFPTPTPLLESPEPLECSSQTCFSGEKYHPCGEYGLKELTYWQNSIIAKKDVLMYYKNRMAAEKRDLKTDVEQFIKPSLEWFGREIQRHYDTLSKDTPTPKSMTEKQIEFLKERMGWMEEEQKYKEDLLEGIDEAEKTLEEFEFISNYISILPDKCLSSVKVKCQSECTGDDVIYGGTSGCHNAFSGCQPIRCSGGNPCPVLEIDDEAKKLNELTPKLKDAYDEIILLILQIKKERIPKYTL